MAIRPIARRSGRSSRAASPRRRASGRGDQIVEINGSRIDTFADIATYVALRPNEPMDFRVLRDGGEVRLQATPRQIIETDRFGNQARIGQLGIGQGEPVQFTRLPFYQLPGAAVDHTVGTVKTMLTALGQVISGRRPLSELGGPLKIAQVAGQQASLGLAQLLLVHDDRLN